MKNPEQHNIFNKMEDDIHHANIDEKIKNRLLRNLLLESKKYI